ncbi:DNA-binding transcriptional MocR family regulator [Microbacteriaceae bacterium SG_E_30_P1]|uniref:DNA-binding transcriptional MocR family regulator n=1 Tax=Antiquaquibacter oligotrophicus TaxID=2880260 RepID=A0ABT6KNX2_9MICO|nr:aminotransferase class I/II-fold pyridoxal phosphate-dependent enzyme [Antiquaquibacter oligotrophicus]MDH6181465.1 DNA-binding transcriptional MocR family regulator [Antiquaquibacter oligotrophicus]UDF12844.1 aminotransferase class I/II-fold pyridoxal phosphate-dependent enzyme [Antiquaquibacter oligotrophicus]
MKSVVLAIDEPTPRGIAAGISRLITTGDLAPGDRLPTVRALAAELGVSPATVSHAWQTLAAAGLIVTRGRSGSTVRAVPREWLPLRYRDFEGETDARLDLSRGTPDPELLPRIALDRAGALADTQSYQLKPDIPHLHDLLRDTWPAPVESITVTNGALDAIDRVLASLVRFGDRVVVENPTFPPFLDLLEQYGLEGIPVALDADGMRVDQFTRALSASPTIVLLQPRAHNPTGVSMTPSRAEQLARALRRSRTAQATVVVEDDHSGAISTAPDVSLATWLPERVLHIRSFSKSHGPDLRIGALGGPRDLVDRIVARRLLGPGWTSRMVQSILFTLLTAPESVGQIDAARDAYARRQDEFRAAMRAFDVDLPDGDGLNAWLPVADERAALVSLAAAGIRVAPGSPFRLVAGEPHVRVTVGLVRDDVEVIASALAAASRA